MTLPRTPSFRLDGRRALVAGASRGIGAAAAAALAEAGAHVVLLARSQETTEKVAAIRAAGGRAEALLLDVTDEARLRGALADREPFDILVNNVGGNRPQKFIDVTLQDFDHLLGLNLRSAFFVAQAVVRGMIEGGRKGSVIHVSSQMGHVGAENRTVYCASKSAIEGLSKAMAVELACHGIRVNTLCPTFVETAMTSGFLADADFRRAVLSKIKLGRLAQVEDLMGAIVFLAGDAAAMMTGSALIVDGGWTAE